MTTLAIAPDTVVTLSYAIFDEKGRAFDHTPKDEPLRYVHGYAQIVPGLESRLAGLHAGERREFTVDPGEAFGERDDEGIFEVDKSDFPDASEIAEGDEFLAQGPDGEHIPMRVIEIRPEGFVVDTNHPLAGQRVRFEVEVNDVRAASEEEIAAAQAELQQRAEADAGGCGCAHHHHGHDHDDHDHPHDHDHDHEHGHEPSGLVQLSKKTLS
jgi:FKBP-type peptidyl-prolyl cis-trans isomerase SlyD